MPRSYSFDHFQVPKTLPQEKRGLRGQDKKRVAQSRPHPEGVENDGGIHYGKRFAQTEELYTAHQMAAQLEELARPEPDAKFSHGPEFKAPKAKKSKRAAQPVATPVIGGTAPIGALPPTREPPPRGRLMDLVDEAQRQLQAIQGGLGDAAKAVSRLASLPVEVVRLAARRFHLVNG
ncbi:hypothetical protein [Pyxidicoccus xibeiensis]|uniref:hypothetical protein n=1 Tax=Pyxidicoccus xibeiensis TaxID=2906759 RepID=UPI0020A809F4|nr:hypothetical protein [Pyxidicoccus xibeiensis]MCP3141128.1 hypothetical protein [Pyxidicoccus xibeiensis]